MSTLMQLSTQALLFDFDGTLVDTEPLHYEAFVQVLKEIGINYVSYEDHCKIYLGSGAKHILTSEVQRNNKETDIDKLIERKKEIFTKLLEKKGAKSVPGAISFLSYAKSKGLKLAIVSGGHLENIKDVMKITGIPDVFEVYVTHDDIKSYKPDPEGFLLAAKKLGVRPEECLVFEDALNGIEAAKRASMKRIAIGTYIEEEKFREVDGEVRFIKDFRRFVKELTR